LSFFLAFLELPLNAVGVLRLDSEFVEAAVPFNPVPFELLNSVAIIGK